MSPPDAPPEIANRFPLAFSFSFATAARIISRACFFLLAGNRKECALGLLFFFRDGGKDHLARLLFLRRRKARRSTTGGIDSVPGKQDHALRSFRSLGRLSGRRDVFHCGSNIVLQNAQALIE